MFLWRGTHKFRDFTLGLSFESVAGNDCLDSMGKVSVRVSPHCEVAACFRRPLDREPLIWIVRSDDFWSRRRVVFGEGVQRSYQVFCVSNGGSARPMPF